MDGWVSASAMPARNRADKARTRLATASASAMAVHKRAYKAHARRAMASASAMPARRRGDTKRVPGERRRPQSPCLRAQECIQSGCPTRDGVRNRHACAQEDIQSACPLNDGVRKYHACAQEGIQSAYPARASDLNRHTHARLSTNTFAWKSPSSGSPNSSATS